MHIVVTGGAGYIGSTLVPTLLQAGHRVTVIDRLYFGDTALRRTREKYPEALRIVRADVRRVDPRVWVSGEQGAWEVAAALDDVRHFTLVAGRPLRLVSRRDPFERRAGALSQYRTPRALIEKEKLLKAKRSLAARKRNKTRR